jgi:hypothetical protein
LTAVTFADNDAVAALLEASGLPYILAARGDTAEAVIDLRNHRADAALGEDLASTQAGKR